MSHKKKYQSKFGAKDLITASQYLAECIIIRRINKKGISLPDRFWSSEELQYQYWKKAFLSEKFKADALLRKFDEDCTIKALENHECKVVLSLQNKKVRRIASELQKQKELNEKVKEDKQLNVTSTNYKPRPKKGKKNLISKLK